MVATVEMAVTKGNYGIILLSSITNMLEKGGYGFLYRALFLKKENEKWEIKSGVQWDERSFMNASKTKWTLPESETIENVFWKKTRICQLSQQCEAQLQGKEQTNDNKNKTYEWSTTSTSTPDKNIWQDLKIEESNGTATSGGESDFWNGNDAPLGSSSTIATSPQAIFLHGSWASTDYILLGGQKTTFESWFNIFKTDKGEWKTKSS